MSMPTRQSCQSCRPIIAELREQVSCYQAMKAGVEERIFNSLDAALSETVGWACQTFPEATVESCAAHLASEAQELKESPRDASEMADVVMLVAHLAHHAGVDLAAAVREKLEVNRGRTWGAKNAEGFREHLPGQERQDDR